MIESARRQSRETVVSALLQVLDQALPPDETQPVSQYLVLDILNHIKEYRPCFIPPTEEGTNVALGGD